jgi:hypothetical protein
MSRYLHTLSAVLFYLLGLAAFGAYVLLKNAWGGYLPSFVLNVIDIPLLVVGALYGGMSVYRSLKEEHAPSPILGIFIALPLILVIGFFVVLNFWTITQSFLAS